MEFGKLYAEHEKEETITPDTPRFLLPGLKKLNISFKLLTGPISDLYSKSKYQHHFDIAVLSLKSDSVITPEFK